MRRKSLRLQIILNFLSSNTKSISRNVIKNPADELRDSRVNSRQRLFRLTVNAERDDSVLEHSCLGVECREANQARSAVAFARVVPADPAGAHLNVPDDHRLSRSAVVAVENSFELIATFRVGHERNVSFQQNVVDCIGVVLGLSPASDGEHSIVFLQVLDVLRLLDRQANRLDVLPLLRNLHFGAQLDQRNVVAFGSVHILLRHDQLLDWDVLHWMLAARCQVVVVVAVDLFGYYMLTEANGNSDKKMVFKRKSCKTKFTFLQIVSGDVDAMRSCWRNLKVSTSIESFHEIHSPVKT